MSPKFASSGALFFWNSKLTMGHVTSIKIDPYMNVDAGTMAPTEYEHCSQTRLKLSLAKAWGGFCA